MINSTQNIEIHENESGWSQKQTYTKLNNRSKFKEYIDEVLFFLLPWDFSWIESKQNFNRLFLAL